MYHLVQVAGEEVLGGDDFDAGGERRLLLLLGFFLRGGGRRARAGARSRSSLLLSSFLLRRFGGVANFSREKIRRQRCRRRLCLFLGLLRRRRGQRLGAAAFFLDRSRVADAAGEKFCERRRLLGRGRRRRRRGRGCGAGDAGRATTLRRFSDTVRLSTVTRTRSRATSSGGVSATTPRRPLYSASDRPTSSTAVPTASDSSRAGECG